MVSDNIAHHAVVMPAFKFACGHIGGVVVRAGQLHLLAALNTGNRLRIPHGQRTFQVAVFKHGVAAGRARNHFFLRLVGGNGNVLAQ